MSANPEPERVSCCTCIVTDGPHSARPETTVWRQVTNEGEWRPS